MEDCLEEILAIEWEMFTAVKNAGGPADCQRDPDMFRKMRAAQFDGWDAETREKYLADLRAAQAAGRNLPTEKYARMMETTWPDEYAAIRDRLPEVSPACRALAGELCDRTVRGAEAFARRYPLLAQRGRPIRASSDGPGITSIETYSRCEYLTYGEETLRALLRQQERADAEGRNLYEEEVGREVVSLGYRDLDAAEAALRAGRA